MKVAEQLRNLGWSEETARFLSDRLDDPRLRSLRRAVVGPPTSRRRTAKATIPRSFAKRVFERDAYRCVDCGGWHDLTVDHVIPESAGGPLTLENTRTRCRSCNAKKGTRR